MLLLLAALLIQPDARVPSQSEVETLEACIAEAPTRQASEQCRGLVSGPCINTRDGGTTVGMVECLRRELSIWGN